MYIFKFNSMSNFLCIFPKASFACAFTAPNKQHYLWRFANCRRTVCLFFNEALACALAFRMTTNSLCLTKTSTQKWDPSWSEATTVRPAASSFSSTIWPWTRSTSRSAGRRWWRSWMAKTTWTGGFEKQKEKIRSYVRRRSERVLPKDESACTVNSTPLYFFRDDLSNIPYTTMCIKESIRLYPPVPAMSRKLNKPITFFDGRTLPAGMLLKPLY